MAQDTIILIDSEGNKIGLDNPLICEVVSEDSGDEE